MNLKNNFFKKHLSKFKLYRKWHGGIWEYHYISLCDGKVWISTKKPYIWPDYIIPFSDFFIKKEIYKGKQR